MKGFLSTILAVAALSAVSGQEVQLASEGFLPPNDLRIPVGDVSHRGVRGGNGLNQVQFNEVMDRIERLYTDVVRSHGGTLKVNRLWTDDTVNASAQRMGDQWVINMYGGLARHPDVNFEGFSLVACHEMGHHLGGFPKVQAIFGGAWASNEGQADYFATLKCLRQFFAQDDNASIVAKATIDPLARTRCMSQFTNQSEQDLCLRISMAGESTSYLFQDLKKENSRPTFSTPDNSQVSQTDDNHPATQCRMDTYFQGSLCTVPVSESLSDSDFKPGSCIEGSHNMGLRPRCWFSPTSTGGGGGGGGNGSCPIGDQTLCDQLCQMDPSYPFCKKAVFY